MMSVIWVRRDKKKDEWHAVADYWDPNTLCGLPVKHGSVFDMNPSGKRCMGCEQKRESPPPSRS